MLDLPGTDLLHHPRPHLNADIACTLDGANGARNIVPVFVGMSLRDLEYGIKEGAWDAAWAKMCRGDPDRAARVPAAVVCQPSDPAELPGHQRHRQGVAQEERRPGAARCGPHKAASVARVARSTNPALIGLHRPFSPWHRARAFSVRAKGPMSARSPRRCGPGAPSHNPCPTAAPVACLLARARERPHCAPAESARKLVRPAPHPA